jgi:hypothetical protein
MSDLHIADFYKDVAKILVRLYNSFPQKIILYVDDITGPDQPDEFGLHSERFLAGFSTMVWLGEQGYLQFDSTVRQEALDQVVLTEKGFLMLSSRSPIMFGEPENETGLPASVQADAKRNINQLRRSLKSGSSIFIEQCVSQLLAGSVTK